MKLRRKIELLSPAKDKNCGREAILHGADAVYIGAPKFGARAAAGNSTEDIRELCAFAHVYDARVYVALNTILLDDEMEEAERLIWELYRAGADALIIQDMGILNLDLPPIPLHASTQTDNRTPEKVKFLEEAGFTQVVLARELSLEQIRHLSETTSVALEAFVHGALCVSYSGQCYLSAAISGRSANRGECAQYCRLPYTLVDADGKVIVSGKHLLSLKDMNRSEELENLLDAGITSLKIEGRLKDVSYVKNITAFYRTKLDGIFARRPEYGRTSSGRSAYTFQPVPEKSFNRGFTSYLLHGKDPDITSFDSPKSMGEPAGKVKELKGDSFTVSGLKTTAIHNGDGLTFFNTKGELEGFRVNRAEGNRIYPADRQALKPGTLLYRNLDHEFEKLLSKPSAERKLSVSMELLDNPAGFTLVVTDETDARIMLSRPFEKELAKQSQEENIRAQLSRLGNTPFEATEVKISFSQNWFVPSSVLAEMRRVGVERLLETRKIRYRREWVKPARYRENLHSYGEEKLTYLGNVANKQAASFYQSHGVTQISPAFELEPQQNAPLMFTKHCLRYSLGWCPVHQKQQSPWREPYYLLYKDRRLRLEFDCKACEMRIML
ncbi:MAG: U32 family peptidase [Tannerellaceae bacterium]|jgi:putative protease|nr:U32 family peptidase [Tannerellaceae bacterium]